MGGRYLLPLLLLSLTVLRSEANEEKLKELVNGCDGDEGNFFRAGHVHQYKYYARAEAGVKGATQDRGRIDLECDVEIHHYALCFYELKVTACHVAAHGGPPENETPLVDPQSLQEVTKHGLWFSLRHGELDTIIASPEDHLASLNLKKGLLSIFAVPRSEYHQGESHVHRDVQGHCPRTLLREDDTLSTSKNMARCRMPSREDWQLSPISLFWNMSFAQVLINSTQDCQYTLENENIKTASCQERHALKIFSTHNTEVGTQTKIGYEVVHVYTGLQEPDRYKKVLNLAEMKVAGIEYEYERTPDPTSNPPDFETRASQLLSDLVLGSEEEIHLGSVPQYHNFVAYLRSAGDLLPFTKSVVSCNFIQGGRACTEHLKESGEQYLQGALVQCNTIPCMKAISHLAVYEHISPTYLNMVLYSWTNLVITKSEYLDEILVICKSRDYRLCWLSLGSVISNYVKKHPEVLTKGRLPGAVTSAMDHLAAYLAEDCNVEEADFPPDFTPLQRHDYLRGIVKAIGNIGQAALVARPDVLDRLHRCSRNEKVHGNVRVASVEVLNRMEPSPKIYDLLMGLVKDKTLSTDVRHAAYHTLAQHLNEYDITSDIARVLREEQVNQFKTYVITHLRNLQNKQHPTPKEQAFLQKLNEKLEENEVDLDDTYVDPALHSFNTITGHGIDIPYFPVDQQKFGYTLDTDWFFTPDSAAPYSFNYNLTLELFSKIVDILEFGITPRDWHSFSIWSKRLSTDAPGIMKWLEENAFEVFQRLGLMGDVPPTDPEIAFLDQRTRDSLKKLQEMYYNTFKKHYPTLMLNLKMFGTEVDFLTLQDIFTFGQGQYFMMATTQPLGSLKDGLNYRANRAARFIEAYYHVPTFMGVPLNWTLNFTAMHSLRGQLRVDPSSNVAGQPAVSGGVALHPSFALSVISGMVLDLPQVVRVGVQCNTSAYSSTSWDVEFTYSEPSDVRKLSLKRPQKPQRYLELYRTTQLVKNDEVHDIPDPEDAPRVTVRDCTSDSTSSVLGFQLCRERSHLNVTKDLSRPWFPLAGRAHWKVCSDQFDKELKAYVVNMAKPTLEDNNVKLGFMFEAPGSMYRRGVHVDLNLQKDTREGSLMVKVPETPDFEIALSRVKQAQGETQFGVVSDYLVKLGPERKYQIKCKNTVNRDPSSSFRNPHFSRKGSLSLETPNNLIEIFTDTEVNKLRVRSNLEAKLSNKHPEWNWFKRVLASHWFESDDRAWIKVAFDAQDMKTDAAAGGYHRKGTVKIETPDNLIDMDASFERNPPLDREYNVHVKKTVKSSGKLLTFIDAHYHMNNKSQGIKGQVLTGHFNVTIPRHSWSALYKREISPSESSRTFTATRIRLVPKTPEGHDFVGFWTPDSEALFRSEERSLKFRMQLKMHPLGAERLPDIIRGSYQSDDPLLWGQSTSAEIALVYNIHEKRESATLRGTFNRFMYNNRFLSWEREYKLHCTRSEIELHTSGHYVRSLEHQVGDLDLVATFAYLPTGGQSVYRARAQRFTDQDGCLKFDMGHSFTSDLIVFSANHSLECYPGALEIAIRTRSPHWDKLNFDLKQTALVGPKGSEEMEYTGPLTKTRVTGDWNFISEDYVYNKRYTVMSHSDLIPSLQAELEMRGDGYVRVEAEIPEMGLKKVRMLRTVSDGGTKLKRRVIHIDTDSEEEHQDLNLKVKLYNPIALMIRGTFRPELFSRVFWFYREKVEIALRRIHAASQDPEHPLNKMLEPYLRMTLHDKLSQIYYHTVEDLHQAGTNAVGAVQTLRPLYYPYLQVVIDNKRRLMSYKDEVLQWFRERSTIGWFYHYFEVDALVRKQWEERAELPHKVEESLRKVTDDLKHRDFNFYYTGRHPFFWANATKYPKWSKERFLAWAEIPWFHSQLQQPAIRASKVSKTAAIYGSHHVITFDGLVYEFPEYPSSECSYLLAHEVRTSSFSLIVSSNALKAVFPEVTVILTSDNKILVNGYREEQAVPFKSPNGRIAVTREGKVIKITTEDLVVLCEPPVSACVVNIGPLYRGGVIGLLGNADGETYNEFMLPDGQLTTDTGTFVSSFEVGGKSQCMSVPSRGFPTWTREEKNACKNLLNNNVMSFHACIGILGIDHLAVQEACMWDIRNGKDRCDVEEGLTALCYLQGIRMTPDDVCVSKRGIKKEVRKVDKELEVILVVNQHLTLFPSGLKGLENLLRNVHQLFESAGYEKIQYGLVGFGGKSGSYHLYSPTGKLLVDKDTLVSRSFAGLEFRGESPSNAIEAMTYAASMIPHSPRASRVYLLFTSEDHAFDFQKCGVRNFRECVMPTIQTAAEKFTRLGRLALALKSQGDVAYSFAKYPALEMKKLYGVRNGGEPLPRGETIEYPPGDVARLAAITGGAAFQQTYVENNQPPTFFKEAAREILKRVSGHVNHCRQCLPSYGPLWDIRTSCAETKCPLP